MMTAKSAKAVVFEEVYALVVDSIMIINNRTRVQLIV
jgi:hypothetical protein